MDDMASSFLIGDPAPTHGRRQSALTHLEANADTGQENQVLRFQVTLYFSISLRGAGNESEVTGMAGCGNYGCRGSEITAIPWDALAMDRCGVPECGE